MVSKFDGRRACTAFTPVPHHKVGCLLGLNHRFDQRNPFCRVAHAQLDADRFAARQLAQLRHKCQQLQRAGKGRMPGR